MKRLIALIGLLATALLSMAALAEAPSAERLLDQARRKFTSINDYAVDVKLDVKSEAIAIKGMAMTLYYKKPDKTKIVAKQGFAAMPRDVMLGNVMDELTKNCRPILLKTEKKSGIECYVLRLDPVRAGSQPKTTLWIDKARMLVRATRTGGPYPVKSEWQYAKVDEKYDLPRRINAEITSPETGMSRHGHSQAPPSGGGTQTIRATITFSNYRVNKGIRDSFFKPEKPPAQKRK